MVLNVVSMAIIYLSDFMKKGEGDSTFGTIGSIILVLIVLGLLTYFFWDKIKDARETVNKCPGYCSDICGYGDYTGIELISYDKYCQESSWDVSNNDYYKNKYPNKYVGKELNLKCCKMDTLPPTVSYTDGQNTKSATGAQVFLSSSSRTSDSGTSGSGSSVSRPAGSLYFADNPTPLSNGITKNIYSNVETELSFKFNIAPTKACAAYLYDQNGKQVENILEGTVSKNTNIQKLTIKPKSLHEGQLLTLAIVCGNKIGDTIKYNPSDSASFQQVLNLRVLNPIKIVGLSSAYEKEKRITVSCEGVDCIKFEYGYTTKDSTSCNVVSDVPVGTDGKGYIILDTDLDNGRYLCVEATSKTNAVYTKVSDYPINIDITPPTIIADYLGSLLVTQVQCYDNNKCTNEVLYHYISDPSAFIAALVGGVKNPYWCPIDDNSYSKINSNTDIPYYFADDFKVLCVRVKDEAGNSATDILITYNAYNVLQDLTKTYAK